MCSAWILSVLMGHTPSTIWPALSLSDSTCIGRAVIGLFKYTAGSLPNAAPVTEIRRFLLNSWDTPGVSWCMNFVSLLRKVSACHLPAKLCIFVVLGEEDILQKL